MAAISLCMIAKDEEEVLARCLSSICQAVDEIIVVDTGSCDGTKAAAREFTDQVYDFLWQEDFSAARNFSFSKGRMEYLMWLDADDVVPDRERERLWSLRGGWIRSGRTLSCSLMTWLLMRQEIPHFLFTGSGSSDGVRPPDGGGVSTRQSSPLAASQRKISGSSIIK